MPNSKSENICEIKENLILTLALLSLHPWHLLISKKVNKFHFYELQY